MTSKRRGNSFSWCKITIFPVKTTIYFSQDRDERASGYLKGSGYFHSTLNGILQRIVFPLNMLKNRENFNLLIHPKELILSIVSSGNYFSVMMMKKPVFLQQNDFAFSGIPANNPIV
jgi:hypothetical protein